MSLLLRKILLFLLVGVLFFPLVQSRFELISIKPLNGAFIAAADTSFSIEGWFTGKYQAKKEKYLNENFGFRNPAVRLNNQVDFSLFAKTNVSKFVIGQQGCVYAKEHLDAYTGKDFIGEDSIRCRMQRLKFVQDTLAKMGKTFLLVFAPGKASFYPEYFPAQYSNAPVEKNNYRVHLKQSKELGVNYIDFNKYFIDNKYTSKYPLYPLKFGIHWSDYGTCVAMDSLVKYLEKKRNIDLPDFYWKEIKTATARNIDIDIVPAMNLLYFSSQDTMAYPRLMVQSAKGKKLPRIMTIGDSFYATLYNKGFTKAFSRNHFWYYNKSLVDLKPTRNIPLEEEIRNSDVILIVSTEANLKDMSWGFIDDAYNLYAKGTRPYYDATLPMINYIKTDAAWMKSIQDKAAAKGIPTDSMLYLDVKWMLDEEAKKQQ
jgi:hypothetical protein